MGLRLGILNIVMMTGKGRELACVMQRREVDVLSVQENRWKGCKTGGIGTECKLYYHGMDRERNGVCVI